MYGDISLKGLKGMPDNVEIIGFNLISTNRNKSFDTLSYPVAVSIRTGEKKIYVKTPSNDWMLYSDAIIKLEASNNEEKIYDENEINRFFRSILSDANTANSLVLVDTSNRLNNILTYFQDKNIKINDVYKDYKNIRVIRMKSNGDVPDIVGVNDKDSFEYFTHILRQLNITYSDYSSVPVVNHLAKSFQEVLLIKDINEVTKVKRVMNLKLI